MPGKEIIDAKDQGTEPDPVISVLPSHRPLPSGLNLALQGGGAHGAFTWGVLDCLLERAPFQIDGVSGTSAGAVNAVALAAGFMEDGTEGARRKLEDVWRAVSRSHDYMPLVRRLQNGTVTAPAAKPTAAHVFFRAMTRVFSPYEFNPFEIDPLRVVLQEHIDFAGLRKHAPMALYINATDAQSGRGRIFTGDEITIDAVLASACLPSLRQAVKIDNRFYWDGGFSANPPILPLIEKCRAADTMIVRLTPERSDALPTRVNEIQGKVNQIMFSQPLRREVEMIEIARRMASSGVAVTDSLAHRMKGHRFHLLDGTPFTSELRADSHMMPDWDMLAYLNHSGRTATTSWLKRHRSAVGRRSSVDLAKKFL